MLFNMQYLGFFSYYYINILKFWKMIWNVNLVHEFKIEISKCNFPSKNSLYLWYLIEEKLEER